MTYQPHLPLIIDSFAGGGGASTGIEMALGRSPDVAINHSEKALALHAANHPETLHLDSNIWDVDPLTVTGGRHVGLLWASPDCKHFSKAKGGAPRDRNIRDLAWVVVRWAEEAKPDVICMENVEEFVTWGPTDNDGQPIKWLAGQTFELWISRLKKAGYRVKWRELRACDYGAPTIRKRWFLVARRDGRPIVWPKPTHGDPKSAEVRKGKLLPWRTAAECIDWSLPCPSIFDTGAEIMAKHGLRAVRPLASNTLARVARGMKRYVIEAERPFLVNLTHGGRVEDAAEPFKTITGAHRGEKAVVDISVASAGGFEYAPRATLAPHMMSLKGTARRDSAITAPHPTVLAGGGHSALVVPSIVGCGGRAGQSRPRGGDEPFATVTAKADACLVAASLQRFNGGATGSDLRDPAPTVTANSWIKKPGGAAPLGMLAPFLAELGHGETSKTGAKRWGFGSKPLTDQLGTITAGGKSHAIVAPVLTYAQQGGGNRDARDPHHTICASKKDQNSLIAATMVHVGNGERAGQQPRALDIGAPLNTVVASGVKQYPVAAFLAQQNGGPRMEAHAGHDIGSPISTIAATGSHQTPVAAWLAKWFSTPQDPRIDEPIHTVTTKPRFDVEIAHLAVPPFAPEHEARAREVAEFLRAHDAWDGGEFVTLEIAGATFVVVDIGMRMLTPRELYRAQGFPDDYVIEGVWEGLDSDEPRWRAFAKDVQVSCCGNSVCPPLAEAIVAANCQHLVVAERREAQA
ncbi:DNA cytosine methyltransferase [Paracoccus siganidrum]|uniref:DNA (cytosine-5-)-methyltransferase n=1 Tax=Paracoccus siganidrum TaxID=1276757 RepID=A0A419A8S0_9RHOB|nr:DNA cytosine methyltransferase [Paracoccus siganidrum]RJL18229.1 DNA methyltransferase [Paracoccus siganidrum]RMC33406.1 DNA methyltransferase [Paracoccus siganidrum]